jgi:hypothetical protein
MRAVSCWHKGASLLRLLVRPPPLTGGRRGRTHSHRSGPAQDAATALTKTSDAATAIAVCFYIFSLYLFFFLVHCFLPLPVPSLFIYFYLLSSLLFCHFSLFPPVFLSTFIQRFVFLIAWFMSFSAPPSVSPCHFSLFLYNLFLNIPHFLSALPSSVFVSFTPMLFISVFIYLFVL